MTTSPDSSSTPRRSPPPSRAAQRGAGRTALIVGGVILGALWVWFLLSNEVSQAIRKLYADDPDTRQEGIAILEEHADRDEVTRQLLSMLEDTDESYGVRRTCADLLRKNEQLPRLEGVLKASEKAQRFPVLDVLARQTYFPTYLADPSYDIPGTLEAWLGRDGDPTRRRAIEIVRSHQQKQLVGAIRPLIERSGRGNVNAVHEGRLIRSAAAALQGLADCTSAPRLLERSREDPDPQVRMEMMQSAHTLVTRHERCADALPEGRLEARTREALRDEAKLVRMGAVGILKFEKAWAVEEHARLREILSGDFDEGERRGVLELLVATADEQVMADLPAWFHDESAPIRSSATQAVARWVPAENPYLGSLIGIVRDEEVSELGYGSAVRQLEQAIGGYKNLAPWLPEVKDLEHRAFFELATALFAHGLAQGVTRDAFADAWFGWLATFRDLDEAGVEAATASRTAFWDAAALGDSAKAKQALDAAPTADLLWSYERGWLQSR